jgi:hypothetical protein
MVLLTIWRFPKMGVPPNHPFLFGIFHYKPYDGENWIDMEEWRIYDIGYIYIYRSIWKNHRIETAYDRGNTH